MNHKKYINKLSEKKRIRHKMKRIQCKSHLIWTYNINKNSLWYFDDRRYILDDGIKTLTYQHENVKVLFY